MENSRIEKVWAVQNWLFKNEDYRLALELEDSNNRVSLGYILVNPDSPAYEINQEFGWKRSAFKLYKSSNAATENLVAFA